MKKFLIKLVLFLLPFIIAQCIELFVLPIDFFTFRVWEALRITGKTLSMGKFYPNMRIDKTEVGALARDTDHAVPRQVTWITDKYGYRNRNSYEKPQVVIVGDSFVAGDTLSQEEMLSEVLESKLGVQVYSMAPANIRNFLNAPRFWENPPEVLVIETIERALNSRSIRSPKEDTRKRTWSKIRQELSENRTISYIDVLQNRVPKWTMLEFARARVGEFLYGRYTLSVRGKDFSGGEAMFFRPDNLEKTTPKNDMPRLVQILKQYEQVLSERGIQLVFLPIPAKRTVYHEFAPDFQESNFTEVLAAVEAAGIRTVNLYEAFERSIEEDTSLLLYRLDDSHWSPEAVEITAESLANVIRSILDDSN